MINFLKKMKNSKQILSIIFLMTHLGLFAQDTHYQTQQFGTRSALMSGAVVGGVKDNTALFYNPGSLGFIDTAMVSINANLYKVENISINNALGNQVDFKSANFISLPILISGMLPSKNPRLKWGYGLGSPMSFSFNGTGRVDAPFQIVDDIESPGTEDFIGQVQLKTKSQETLAGIGFGYRLNTDWSIGMTNQITIRSVEYTDVLLSRFFLNQPNFPLVSSNIWKAAKYNTWRYSAKFGIAYTKEHFDLGLTLTTPSVNLYGKGNVSADVTANNILVKGQRINILANDAQEKLKANYKSPFKFATGANYKKGKNTYGITIEYCGEIKPYDVIKSKPAAFVRPADIAVNLGSDEFLKVKSAAKAVVNFSLGFEHKISDALFLYFSFRTDNSWFDSSLSAYRGIKPEFTSWDIYHFTSGVSILKGRSTLSLGLLLSAGSNNNFQQNNNLSKPEEGNFLQGVTSITKAGYSAFGLLVGYSFNFKKF